MFCSYCCRLFSFQQPVQQYTPVQKRHHNELQEQGSTSLEPSNLFIEESPRVIGKEEPEIEVYEDVKDIFTPRLLWFKIPIGKEGLKNGETHDPSGKCQVCDMIFSNVSGSFVEAVVRKHGEKGGEGMGFVYRLKRMGGLMNSEPVLSVWLEVGEKLLPMIKLKVATTGYAKSLPTVIPSSVESTNTGSAETLNLAASWIHHCNRSHRECSRLREKEHRLPTRLVDVGTSDGSIKPHLFIPSSSSPFVPYTTLSYRWGPSPFILLTQDSLSSLLDEIPFDLLPKTNQDAIVITRFLGIRYLWIDAMCIIQDLEGDWHKESERMGDIYKDSYVTISASMAEVGEKGCFVERGPLQASFRAPTRDGERKRQKLPESNGRKFLRQPEGTSPEDERMIRRRLSRPRRGHRRLHGGSSDLDTFKVPSKQERQLWQEPIPNAATYSRLVQRRQETRNMRMSRLNLKRYDPMSEDPPEMTIRTFQTDLWASEVDASPLSRRAWTLQERLLSLRILHFSKSQLFFECPCSRACETWPQPAMKRVRRPFEEECPVEYDTAGSDFSMNGVIIHPLPQHWDEIVELYTDTNLTRPEDKLVAISGLAREIQKETKDLYYAGLWGEDFERSLLWYLQIPRRTKLEKYRAPSWSWASFDGKIGFLAQKPKPGASTSPVATIHTIRTVVVEGQESSTGQIQDGFCRISGTPRKVLRYEKQAIKHRLVLSEDLSDPHCYVDFFPDTIIMKDNFPVDVVCFPILLYRNRIPEEENILKENGSFLAGLVLQPTGEFRDEYRRIGVFRITEESGKEWVEGDGVEERVVTII